MKRLDNINLNTDSLCTGCGLCSIICPDNAINITLNTKGFYEAKLDENKCTSCGLCSKVCYKFLSDKDNYNIEKSIPFLGFSKNEAVREKSSSGGIGRELASYGLLNGYSVSGVRYNYELKRAEHIILEKVNELDLITGSKYMQSYTFDAFMDLKKDKKYIIFGTPCQVYGLRKYIKIKGIEDNFILIDFFCHGVPSYNLWDKYLGYLRDEFKLSYISNINFRDKTYGWHNFSMNIEGNKSYIKTLNKDLYLKTFLSNLCLNESCYNCKLRFNKVYSDIRLGDFWGAMCADDQKGSSIVLANSLKGFKLLGEIVDKIYLKKVEYEDLKSSQYVPFLKKPYAYKAFIQNLSNKNYSLKKIYRKYYLNKYTVGFIKRYLKKLQIGNKF